PEVAILGVSKSAMEPVWNGKEFVPRLMMPISLSFDHRVIDGAAAAGAAPATSKTIIREPVDTLSPVFTLISFTVPANGAGTSIEALSPSTVISDCSASTLSPTLTRISVISTSSVPMSGTLISIAIILLPLTPDAG
ncbi:hypothetical protein HIN56_06755, partial [Salmonella enterica subsp. enterica serovar Choleraesuis]|nr:hypothetical protein [Salmonella enterica subsp. enterica serovar Choleraesuis]